MTSRGICQNVGVSSRKGEHCPFWTKNVVHKNNVCHTKASNGSKGHADSSRSGQTDHLHSSSAAAHAHAHAAAAAAAASHSMLTAAEAAHPTLAAQLRKKVRTSSLEGSDMSGSDHSSTDHAPGQVGQTHFWGEYTIGGTTV